MCSSQQLSVIYVYSSGGYRIFSQKQSSSESRVCIIFSFYCCRCSIVIAIFFFIFLSLSPTSFHISLTHTQPHKHVYQVKRGYLIWTPASAFVFIIVSHIICLIWYGMVWRGVVWCCAIHLCLPCTFSKFIYLRRFNYPACTCTN